MLANFEGCSNLMSKDSKLEVVPIKQIKYCRFSSIGGFPSLLLMHVISVSEEIGEYEMVVLGSECVEA